ncbi:C40 family peptidase [Nocardia australiensis]|uniref:C40 family peptidase n=1 Tax=Nocardia australiensis TaxID=2887191 RepID=UPI001D14DE9F|nr:C40 family peptidase [Nocardia australiensis]
MIPTWLVLAVGAVAVGGVLLFAVLFGSASGASVASDFLYQCDTNVGPNPAADAVLPRPGLDAKVSPAPAPTANPYAGAPIEPENEWQRACLNSLTAPYQLPPVNTLNSGYAVECARAAAQAALAAADAAAIGADPANLAGGIIAAASAGSMTGRCELSPGGAPSAAAPSSDSGAVGQSCAKTADPGGGSVPGVLPNTTAAQALCGQRVDISAVSAGDLVFWGYREDRNYVPSNVGVAVDTTELITINPATGRVVQQSIPTSPDVRVRRVLPGGP